MAHVNTTFIILTIWNHLTHEGSTAIPTYGVQPEHRKAKVPVFEDRLPHPIVQGLHQLWNIFFSRNDSALDRLRQIVRERHLNCKASHPRWQLTITCSTQIISAPTPDPGVLSSWITAKVSQPFPSYRVQIIFSPVCFCTVSVGPLKFAKRLQQVANQNPVFEKELLYFNKQTNPEQTNPKQPKPHKRQQQPNLYRSFWNSTDWGFSLLLCRLGWNVK